MRKTEELLELNGSVDAIIYRNNENGYMVLELDCGGEPITVVGELGDVEPGEELRLLGAYTSHARYGTQFKASVCERRLPATAAAIRKYLGSGVVKGIGPALAKRIVDHFGDDTLTILEQHPEKLREVRGISEQKADEFGQEFERVFGIRALMLSLSQYGIPPSVSIALWKRYGADSMDTVRRNPYVLCAPGLDMLFTTVDGIAEQLGVFPDDDKRIEAGIRFVLSDNLSHGHTMLPGDRLRETACRLLAVAEDPLDDSIARMREEGDLDAYQKKGRLFLALPELFGAECLIAGRLLTMRSCFPDTGEDFEAAIDRAERETGIRYEALQRKAIATALSRGFLILTGGPGTGKTTTLNAMLSLFSQRGYTVALAAPTGRAAKRMSDLTGHEAKTIHRLLEVGFGENGQPTFMRNETNPLLCDVAIIDEMSMVDTTLFAALLCALKTSCRLIMVGDSDQLPSVGAGNVLRDMIDSGRLPVVQLTEIFRQAAKSAIVTNAHLIVHGEMPDLLARESDFFFMQRLEPDEARHTVVELCTVRLPQSYQLDPLADIQVLCPGRKGPLGVETLNKQLQAALNPNPEGKKQEITHFDVVFREGDKIMQIRNNYDLIWKRGDERGTGVFNGDIGRICAINRGAGVLLLDFDGKQVEYSTEMLSELEHAYAVTVHKSQGSEFEAVVIPVLGGYDRLHYRNLLYTAVTRAKKLLVLVGSQKRVAYMVENDRRTLRYTGLKNLLLEEADI